MAKRELAINNLPINLASICFITIYNSLAELQGSQFLSDEDESDDWQNQNSNFLK